jgi:cell division transport system permease protein
MNWAAVSTVTVLLLLFGLSLQASWQLEGLLNQFGSQLEVSVYLETGVQAQEMRSLVQSLPEVAKVTPIVKEQAWGNLVKEMGLSDINGATAQLSGNPLVDEMKVKAKTSEAVPVLAEKLRKLHGVDEVQYVDEAVDRLSQLNRGLNWVSVAITSLLSMTAIAVINTTIRLIVLARRREIEVMQLVGATSTWIYLPFILQGVFLGSVGAIVAWGVIGVIQKFLSNLLAKQPEFIQFLMAGIHPQPNQWLLLPLALLALGSSVGFLGSLFAVRKYAVR